MVSLPSIPQRFVTTEAAKSSVSASDVSAPYTMLGKALDTLGDGLEKVAVSQAVEAGHKAVTSDAEGNLNVQLLPPLTGAAGKAYNRVAQQSYTMQVEDRARQEIQKAQIEHDGNPAAFQQWGAGYLDSLVAKQPNPAVQDAIKVAVGRSLTSAYDGMLVRRHNLDLHTANIAFDAKIKTLGDEMQTLALQSGADTPDMADRVKDFNHLLDEKVNNPLFAFPKEKADLIRDATMTQVYGAAVINGTQKVYQEQGFEAARAHLRGSVDALGTKIKSANTIFSQGMSWLKSEEAGLRGERDAVTREWSEAKPQAETLPRESLLDLQDRARSVGNVRVEQDIAVRVAALDAVKAIRGLPVTEQAQIATTGKVTPVEAIAASIHQQESGGRPTAGTSVTGARGGWQIQPGTFAQYAKPGEKIDNPADNEAVGKRIVADLYQKAGGDPARVAVGYFSGPGNIAPPGSPTPWKTDKADPTGKTTSSYVADVVGRLTGGTDLTQSRAGVVALGMVKKQLAKDTTQRIADLRSAVSKQEIPDVASISDLSALVNAVGTPEQQRQVAELHAVAEQGEKFRTLDPPQRAAVVSAYQERGKDGATQFERNLAGALANADRQINEAYKSDPYGASYRFAEGAKTLPPLDWNNADEAGAILKAKVTQQNQIRADQDLTAFSALRPAEALALKQQLTQGDGAASGQILGMLSQLPPDIYRATLASDPIKSALDGMVRSYDPVKLNVAMTTLDQYYRADPLGFAHAFGEGTFKRLQDWQAHRDSLTPAQMAERFQKADDPSSIKAREEMGKQFDKQAKDISAANVANALGSWFDRNVPFVNQAAPADGLQAGTMLAEYKSLARERFIETGDMAKAQQQAVERLRMVWGPSEVNGGALMRYPPDRYYPAVGGSTKWMADDLNKALEQHIGKPQFKTVDDYGGVGGGDAVTLGRNWTAGLISDQRTEADIKSGRPPSYVVRVTDYATGKLEIPLGEDGKPLRYRFDPAPYQAEAQKEFERKRPGVLQAQEDIAAFYATGGTF